MIDAVTDTLNLYDPECLFNQSLLLVYDTVVFVHKAFPLIMVFHNREYALDRVEIWAVGLVVDDHYAELFA